MTLSILGWMFIKGPTHRTCPRRTLFEGDGHLKGTPLAVRSRKLSIPPRLRQRKTRSSMSDRELENVEKRYQFEEFQGERLHPLNHKLDIVEGSDNGLSAVVIRHRGYKLKDSKPTAVHSPSQRKSRIVCGPSRKPNLFLSLFFRSIPCQSVMPAVPSFGY
jgi:hypothetical protein